MHYLMPDPDMLEVGNGGMTEEEYRAHFSIWALAKVHAFTYYYLNVLFLLALELNAASEV